MKEAQARPSEMLDDILMPKPRLLRESSKKFGHSFWLYGLNLLLMKRRDKTRAERAVTYY